jgi:hypothetical protein
MNCAICEFPMLPDRVVGYCKFWKCHQCGEITGHKDDVEIWRDAHERMIKAQRARKVLRYGEAPPGESCLSCGQPKKEQP